MNLTPLKVMKGDSLSSLKGDSLSSLKGDSLKVELNNSFNSVAVNSPVRTSSLTPIKSPILSPSNLKSTSGETNLNLPITSPLKQYYLRQSPQTVQIPSRPKIPIPDEILSKKRRTSKLSIVSFPDDEESLKSTRKKFQSLKVQEITPKIRANCLLMLFSLLLAVFGPSNIKVMMMLQRIKGHPQGLET
ncbi:hypothetical protein ROZALSC1DRAFT_24278 [Rozella allomycis CSF55]|uniref:Uncharacterized protein n=1 Tax=Rozella allomycis (strain CSF55) TaxID=988480 RepID=A0A4V1IZA4_ROZAC|nr:hypothetical protein ROZALSC1DRAFT_24278 [Rozella allomycis CSF55]